MAPVLERNRSYWGLNALNFFLAQIAAVIVPFINVFLRDHGWRYDQIGMAMAGAGLGSMIFQLPAGVICDRVTSPRTVIAIAAIGLGLCYGLIPLVVSYEPVIVLILFLSGIPGTFFAPLLSTLALAVAGPERLAALLGVNQSVSHAGSAAAAAGALIVVYYLGIQWLFFMAVGLSICGALSALLISRKSLKLSPKNNATKPSFGTVKKLVVDQKILIFVYCLVLFHVANGSLSSFAGLYIKHLGGSDAQVAWLPLIAQPIMIPVAWLCGKLARKITPRQMMLIPFFLLPFRILLYIPARTPEAVIAVTALDGVASGVFGLATVLMAYDLIKEKESGFNSLMGLLYTIPAIGAVAGTALQGYLIEEFGFRAAFSMFAAAASIACILFLGFMPETRK